MSVESTTAQDQLIARLVFRAAPEYFGTFAEESEHVTVEDRPWEPFAVERAFAAIGTLFEVANQMARAELPPPEKPHAMSLPVGGLFDPAGPSRRPRPPVEVVRVRLASPMESVLLLSGAFAAPKVVAYLIALIEQAFTIEPRIRASRAEYEADRLEHELRGAKAKEQLMRLAASRLPASPPMTTAEFWLGENDVPPELEAGESVE